MVQRTGDLMMQVSVIIQIFRLVKECGGYHFG